MIISEQTYTGNGTQREFSTSSNVLSDSHVGVWIDDERIGTDEYNVLGNVVLLNIAPSVDSVITLMVSDNGEDLDVSPTKLSEIYSNIDDVELVSTNMDSVLSVAERIDNGDMDILVSLPDLVVETGDEGTEATYANGVLTIPRGVKGDTGTDGMTPQYEFVYNSDTGNLEYNLTGYIPTTDLPSEEI